MISNQILNEIRENRTAKLFLSDIRGKKSRPLTNEDLQRLADALAENSSVKILDLSNNQLNDDAIAILAPALKQNRSIETLYLQNNRISEAGAALLGEALANHPTLIKLDLKANKIADSAIHHLAPIMESPMLYHIMVNTGVGQKREGEIRERALPLMEAALEFKTKNISRISPEPVGFNHELNEVAQINQSSAQLIMRELKGKNEDEWSIRQITRAQARHGLITESLQGSERATYHKLQRKLQSMPYAPPSEKPNADRLMLSDDETGLRPIDHPQFWTDFSTHLDHGNLDLSKDDVMRPNRDGDRIIQNAIRMGQTRQLVSYLNERGEYIEPSDLFEKGGQPTPLLETLIDEHELSNILTQSNWQQQGICSLKHVLNNLPDEAQEQVLNQHSLTTTIAREERHAQRER